MANTLYDYGDRPTFSFEVRNYAGVLADPTTLIVKVKNPAGTVTTKTYPTDVEVVRLSVGRFTFDQTLNAEGEWHYRAEATGAIVGAGEQTISVRDSAFY